MGGFTRRRKDGKSEAESELKILDIIFIFFLLYPQQLESLPRMAKNKAPVLIRRRPFRSYDHLVRHWAVVIFLSLDSPDQACCSLFSSVIPFCTDGSG